MALEIDINLIYLSLIPRYTVPNSRGHGMEFGQFSILLPLATFSLISCCYQSVVEYYQSVVINQLLNAIINLQATLILKVFNLIS